MSGTTLGCKQTLNQDAWLVASETIEQRVPREQMERLVEQTVAQITQRTQGKTVAFAWSGGKDSLVLERLCSLAGIEECMMGLCDLEYPAFLQWVTEHMPPLLEVVHTGQDLEWLASHLDLLFPQGASTAAKWFKIVQHTAQAQYFKRYKLDMLLLGRRRMDGNYTGPAGQDTYTNAAGVTRYSPMRDWTHEDILAFLQYYAVPIPPIYAWPNGYRVGTGPWPARQWTGSVEQGWREVWQIDPTVVRGAAQRIPSAQAFLDEQEGA